MISTERKGRKHHGMSGTPEYKIWCGMRERCYDTAHPSYRLYGGKGISICDQWDSFLMFIGDMGRRPSEGHSIDRVDVSGDYEPGNCRWATRYEQANNRSNNRHLCIDGRQVPHKEAAEILGVSYHSIRKASRNPDFSLDLFLGKPKKATVTIVLILEIRRLSSLGNNGYEIAKLVGCSPAKVYQILGNRNSRGTFLDYDKKFGVT